MHNSPICRYFSVGSMAQMNCRRRTFSLTEHRLRHLASTYADSLGRLISKFSGHGKEVG